MEESVIVFEEVEKLKCAKEDLATLVEYSTITAKQIKVSEVFKAIQATNDIKKRNQTHLKAMFHTGFFKLKAELSKLEHLNELLNLNVTS